MAEGTENAPSRRPLVPILVAAALGLACLSMACFGGVLFGGRQFGYRDAAQYYYPLYLRVQQEWDAGRWPLWCPELNGGSPLLGNPTAAVLYPGKVVFFLLPYPWAMRLYVVGHVYLAAATMWLLLRSWGVSATGASLGAMAYAFGAPVLSQVCNVIFLVGAAWVPLGFLTADRWLRLGRRRALVGLALVLAMEVLGGDPESAYVTVVCALAYALGLAAARPPSMIARWLGRIVALGIPAAAALLALGWWSARVHHALTFAPSADRAPWQPPARLIVVAAWLVLAGVVYRRARRGGDPRGLAAAITGVVVASIVALALTGAQLVPILELAQLGYRGTGTETLHNIYPFSVHPLQLAGSVWPDFAGGANASSRSWMLGLGPRQEDSLWMPSLYLGGLTLVLATAAAGFRGGPPWRAWLTGVALATLLAALGAHASPLFWARCVPGWSAFLGPLDPPSVSTARGDGLLSDGDGSPYWLLAAALPGFTAFRYPAKLLVFTALAVSGLAGIGWDRVSATDGRRARRIAAALAVASLAALIASTLAHSALSAWVAPLTRRAVSVYGPRTTSAIITEITLALTKGVVVYVFAAVLLIATRSRPRMAALVAVLVMVADLGLANAHHVRDVPQSIFETTPRVVELIRAAEATRPSPTPFRVERPTQWWPDAYYEAGAPDRLAESTKWERDRLWLLFALPLGIRTTFAVDPLLRVDYTLQFLPFPVSLDPDVARSTGVQPGRRVLYYPRRAFDLWGTRYFIVPSYYSWDTPARATTSFVPGTTQIYPPPDAFSGPDGPARRKAWERSDDVRILRNDAAFPFAWVVHRARVVPPPDRAGPGGRWAILLEILYQADDFWRLPGVRVRDPHVQAWVETDRPGDVEPFLSRAGPGPNETVTVTVDSPQRLELTAVLHSPGIAVVAEAFYPGWTLTVDGQPAEILRVNRTMRGVALREGTHRLVFEYRPLSFRLGIALSAAGIAGAAALGVWASGLPKRLRPC